MLSGCCLYAVAVLTGAGNSVLSRFCCVQVHKVKTRCKRAGVNDDSSHSARTSRNARSTIRRISFAEWLPAGGWASKAATVSGESGVSGRINNPPSPKSNTAGVWSGIEVQKLSIGPKSAKC